MANVMSAVGIEDTPRLVRWMDSNGVPDAAGLRHIEMIEGGRSNLTYRLELDGATRQDSSHDAERTRSLVLRRPPLGHVLPTAHDMSREYRVLSALYGTAVPVPRPVAFCADPEIVGAPFYVMEYVEGSVLRTDEDAANVTSEQARHISERLADVLAAIHSVDIEAVGLTGFGRPEGYLARQLRRWQQQWQRSQTRPLPEYDRLVARLAEQLPETREGTLVHGDFRLDNALLSITAKPAVAAVVDWEMSTLGDPLADLGVTLTYWADMGDTERLAIPVGAMATARPGFLTGAQFADRYVSLTGRDLSAVGYYIAFGSFKLAVVAEGIHARFLLNKTVGEGFDQIGEAVPALVARAHRILDEGF